MKLLTTVVLAALAALAALASGVGLAGCAATNTQAPLQGAEWRIAEISGAGVIKGSDASLLFMEAGQLAGSGGCNRLMGGYESSAKGHLTITPTGATMMACPQALMNQERKLLDLLPKIAGYDIDASGSLVLRTGDGQRIVARR